MEHYMKLILKALINRGGSSSESYVYQLLTGDVKEGNTSVSEMWSYLDLPLKEQLIDILQGGCDVNPKDWTDKEMVRVIIEYMAKKWGNRTFFDNTGRDVIDRMSDEEYELAIEQAITEKREILINRE